MVFNLQQDFEIGLDFHKKGNIVEAEQQYKKVLTKNSNHFDSLHLLGVINSQKGNTQEAIYLIKKSININNNNPMPYNNLANVYIKLENYQEAEVLCEKALLLDHNYVDALFTYANVLVQKEMYDKAQKIYDRLITINPNLPNIYYNLGILFTKINNKFSSIENYKKAIEIYPNFVNAYYNLGNIYLELNKNELARIVYEKALEYDAKNSLVLNNLGQVFLNLNNLQEAEKCFKKAIKFNKTERKAFHNLIDLQLKLSDWTEIPSYVKLFDNIKKINEVGIPINVHSILDNPKLQKKINEDFLSCSNRPTLETFHHKKNKNSKIKLAYFSADYQDNNPVTYLITDLICMHDRSKFEVYGCSLKNVTNKDKTRKFYEKFFDHFVDLEDLTDVEIRNLCLSKSFDIIVDLNGYTKNSRPSIFSPKLAPIQVNFLGYPGTLGSKDYDYIIADKTVIPNTHKKFYTENVAYLPDTYFVNPSKRPERLKNFNRKDLSLPEDSLIFCCLNQNYKILPNVFNSWMNILRKVNNSILYLSNTSVIAKNNLKNEAHNKGIDPKRIIFANYMSNIEDHLERYKNLDLFLDTIPYNAHTTASDAIWSGLPIVTCIGNSFASRVCSSILHACDLSELITTSLKEYENKAVELALNPKKLRHIKNKITTNRDQISLFNCQKYTKNIENSFLKMYEIYSNGNKSKSFEV